MKSEDLIDAIKNEYSKSHEEFFGYAWREKLSDILIWENKYSKLIEWIDVKIDECLKSINIFNPADKFEEYTNEYFNNYKTACGNLAMLLNFKLIILDKRCSTKMRRNIEYTICKIFEIKYNDMLQRYI